MFLAKYTYLPTHLIYKFECSNCNITCYDETERHLKVRAGEHINTSPLTGKRINSNKKCSVKDHCLLSGHVYSFEDFTVLNYESHKFKRLIKESLLVSEDKPSLNKQVKLLKLELMWFRKCNDMIAFQVHKFSLAVMIFQGLENLKKGLVSKGLPFIQINSLTLLLQLQMFHFLN